MGAKDRVILSGVGRNDKERFEEVRTLPVYIPSLLRYILKEITSIIQMGKICYPFGLHRIRALPERNWEKTKIGEVVKMEGSEGIEEFTRGYKGSPRYFDLRGNSRPPVLNIINGKNIEKW